MRYFAIWCLLIGIFPFVSIQAQSSRTDSIFARFNLKYSPEALLEAKLEYEQANDTIRAIMEQYYSLPMSSRAELVANYETNEKQIWAFIDEFKHSVPKGYQIAIEIRMDNGPLKSIQEIDMQIYKKLDNDSVNLIKADWGMKYPSTDLDSMLNIVNWDPMIFSGIKNLMQVANCISIENKDNYIEVGFARSGLGKYSYLIFPEKLLTVPQIKQYNDQCEFIYYKKNIVLRYEGGMAGPQCFTD